MMDCRITLRDEPVTLMPERALLIERTGTLVVADVHLGKDASFRAAGVPLGGNATADSLSRLTQVIGRGAARRLIVLGDLVHARSSFDRQTVSTVADWRAQHAPVEVILVPGNHDARAGALPFEWKIAIAGGELIEPPFVLTHHSRESPHGYVLSGHVHPAVQLTGRGRQRERLACFLFGAAYGLLPAFGTFTGNHAITPQRCERIFAVAEDHVIEISSAD